MPSGLKPPDREGKLEHADQLTHKTSVCAPIKIIKGQSPGTHNRAISIPSTAQFIVLSILIKQHAMFYSSMNVRDAKNVSSSSRLFNRI
jgi:hypothetical protein